MIWITPEYFQSNNLILQIMKMINGTALFDDLKPLQSSDLINLSLYLLSIFIQIHLSESYDEIKKNKKVIDDISESVNAFIDFGKDSIDFQRCQNRDLQNVFIACGNAKDIDELITKILVYGSESA